MSKKCVENRLTFTTSSVHYYNRKHKARLIHSIFLDPVILQFGAFPARAQGRKKKHQVRKDQDGETRL